MPKKKLNASTLKNKKTNDNNVLYHDEISICSHSCCFKPNFNSINWVECDLCNEWFHTYCLVGKNFSFRNNVSFLCGCEKRKRKRTSDSQSSILKRDIKKMKME